MSIFLDKYPNRLGYVIIMLEDEKTYIVINKISFLFWNVKNKNSIGQITNLVKKYNIDILILAEFEASEVELLLSLNLEKTEYFYNKSRIDKHKIKIFSRYGYDIFEPKLENNKRLTIRKLRINRSTNISIAAVHLISKKNCDERNQQFEALNYIQDIINHEKNIGNKNTLVVGDFNMNPFEEAMVSSNIFNSVMCKEIAQKEQRIVQGRSYHYFYNPSWNLFGDFKKPVGTYYYNKAEHINYKWNIFDQVLLRPPLIDKFVQNDFKIITSDGRESLLTKNGLPNHNISDHLPITFSLKFDEV